ncbi:gamma-glutamyl phosphate reductase [Denitrovibrio acetiphilus DSM 12809]|uniref:Gamma-glutamyl phosphate reductase n=1 Tax=Denitrovibrio acetiphilus (strain DSM 12809 / NBRC 114555 / N2460) TaxID=522772 RepID=D4H0Y8_DENA2|nr:glutamate-5-semialdehyde dehydrogenase [Denitrovibrio acetiphilus]ADD68651.1 gamma-glutamyl phosphate reductase [Denitrovibrio acetiphilus DSM 12809]
MLENMFREAKKASYVLMNVNTDVKDSALSAIAEKLEANRVKIKNENLKDLDYARETGLSDALIDRLTLDDKRIDGMIQAVKDIRSQVDPVGKVVDGYKRPNGLYITKVKVPLGVVGIIFESRPNVTIDAAALCLKSGNVAILRGGKEAVHSNTYLGRLMKEAVAEAGLPKACVNIIEDTDRGLVMEMLKAKGSIDIMIPRGGKALIEFCTEHSLIPLVKHDDGICHVYIDKFADIEMAVSIAVNAKCQRVGVCNTMETLLVHEAVAETVLKRLEKAYGEHNVELRGCEHTAELISCKKAAEEDWSTEYLDYILSVKVVSSIDEAIEHINKYGSMHSESIVTENYTNSEMFLNMVDAAAVYVNASTRWTDGGEFGMGAEIGISTQKLHCRGPMGADDLTTTKYRIYGQGQIK